jgi:hypothetical protein
MAALLRRVERERLERVPLERVPLALALWLRLALEPREERSFSVHADGCGGPTLATATVRAFARFWASTGVGTKQRSPSDSQKKAKRKVRRIGSLCYHDALRRCPRLRSRTKRSVHAASQSPSHPSACCRVRASQEVVFLWLAPSQPLPHRSPFRGFRSAQIGNTT